MIINVMDYGAFADGTNHAITDQDVIDHSAGGTKALWVGTYVAGDFWDYVALQEAIYAAFQNGTLTPNKNSRWLNHSLYIPAGRYRVNKSPTMYEVEGGNV